MTPERAETPAKRAFELLLVVAPGAALGVAAYHLLTSNHGLEPWRAAASVGVAWTFLVAGLIARARRPASRMGVLMLVVGFALLVHQLEYTGSSLVFTVSFGLGVVFVAAFGHAVLAYPSGRLTDALERRLTIAGYSIGIALPVATLLVFERGRSCAFDCSLPGREHPRSLIAVGGSDHLFTVFRHVSDMAVYGVGGAVFVVLVVRRLTTSSARGRWMLAPLLIAGAAAGLRAVSEGVFSVISRSPFERNFLFALEVTVEIALPIALLIGLLRERLARAAVADLLGDLERSLPADVAAAIGRALRDPTLEVVYWTPVRRGYVDAVGEAYVLPEDDPTRAVTRLDHEGEPVAALVHDPALLQEPKLVAAVAAAARLALENARLHAELQAQLGKVRESRARLVGAGDAERRRIERDLHDGAQQRLVALALDLRLEQRRLNGSAPELETVLARAVDELQHAVNDLRELAQGLHPSILTQAGLRAALQELASRTPLIVRIGEMPAARLPPEVEATAYFVACEALTNAVKHAQANTVEISVSEDDRSIHVSVVDDGIGGADPGGTGLVGLADRVEASGGRLWIESQPGTGTRIVGEIPCAS